jgi:hypothetical protein
VKVEIQKSACEAGAYTDGSDEMRCLEMMEPLDQRRQPDSINQSRESSLALNPGNACLRINGSLDSGKLINDIHLKKKVSFS